MGSYACGPSSPAAGAPSPGDGAPGARCPSQLDGDVRLRGDGGPGSTEARTAWSSFRLRSSHATGGIDHESRKLNPSGSPMTNIAKTTGPASVHCAKYLRHLTVSS